MPPKFNFKMDKSTKKLLEKMGDFLTVGEKMYSAGVAADIIAKDAKRRAPQGPTGNLKRGIVARQDKVTSMSINKGVAYVGVDYNIAPHAHLVEYGARGGEMPAKPFMRPAIEAKKGEAVTALENDIKDRITKKLGGK